MNPRTLIALLALALGPALPLVADAQNAPTGVPPRAASTWVYDGTSTLSEAARRRIDALSEETWTRAQTRLAVALVTDTAQQPVDQYALSLFREWNLGDSTAGRAALLVVAVSTRRNHIVVGNQTSNTLTEAARRSVLDEVFRPTARAQGVEAATIRAMEAMRDRVIPAPQPQVAAPPFEPVQPVPSNLPATPEPPAAPINIEPHEAPDEGGLPIGGLSVAALGLGIAAWGVRRSRRRSRERFEAALSEFEWRERRFRTVAPRFPKLAFGTETIAQTGGYREAATAATAEPVEAVIAPLRARVEAARKRPHGLAIAIEQLEAVNQELAQKIAPLDDAEQREMGARELVPVLAELVRSMTQRVAEAKVTFAELRRRWPHERCEDEAHRLHEAGLRAERYAEQHPKLLAAIDFASPASVAAGHGSLSRFRADVDRVLHDAARPKHLYEALREAEAKLSTLRGELTNRPLSQIVQAVPHASAAQISGLKREYHRAEKLRDAGDDIVQLVSVLEALRAARLVAESARPAAPSHSYDASGSGFAHSTDCTTYASSDCASSDCASSDCASSDCASSDCSSSDCAGSSGDW